MSVDQLYVYGVLTTGDSIDTSGLGMGVGGGDVHLLPGTDLAALVSFITPGPIAQTRRNMLTHTAVLERAMAQVTILPVRFGTVAPDAKALTACIATSARQFHAALAEIDGRVELGVKASWREGVIFAEIIAGDPDLARLRDRLRERPANETYYDRVELGRRVESALKDRRAAEAAAIISELAPLAERATELRTLEDDMILNRAFLVHRDKESEFDSRMQQLAERSENRMTFRYVGPVPPYNFVKLHTDWLAGAA